jgi:hypothetical protein
MDRFARAIARFDAANAEDPNRVVVLDELVPKELVYAERMTARLAAFAPEASEVVRLAARAQHIRRWEIPRDEYPRDRAGYHRWRTRLAEHHAAVAAAILRDVGHDDAVIERVADLIRKRHLKTDPEAQVIEDVACLVFLEHHLVDFAAGQPADKVVEILRRTWTAKMSPRARDAALALPLAPEARALVEAALG